MIAAGYVVGVAVVAIAVVLLLGRDGRQRRASDWLWTVAFSVLWPLLLVGVVQAAVIWMAIKRLRRRSRGPAPIAELAEDALLVG